MSHVASVELEIKDLDALEEAAKALGCTLVRGQKTWRWFGRWMNDFAAKEAAYKNGIDVAQYGHGEHTIKVPGSEYEVGIVRNKAGKLVAVFDGWGGDGAKIQQLLGKNLAGLKIEYGVQVATKAARRQGFRVTRKIHQQTGRVQLVCQR